MLGRWRQLQLTINPFNPSAEALSPFGEILNLRGRYKTGLDGLPSRNFNIELRDIHLSGVSQYDQLARLFGRNTPDKSIVGRGCVCLRRAPTHRDRGIGLFNPTNGEDGFMTNVKQLQ